jgi:hypothetical protein
MVEMSEMNTLELAERFEIAFNQIHNWLKKNIKSAKSDKFSDLLRVGYSQHSILRQNYYDLLMFGRLRNSIVHEKIGPGYYIAEPHEQIVNQIENIAAQVFQPRPALSIGTKPAFYYYENALLRDILTVIKKKSYSAFPIYNESGFQWLLTPDCIIQWLANTLNDGPVPIEQTRVKDLYSFRENVHVEFVQKNADMFDVEELFEQYHQKNQKLEAVVITETGEKNEKPLGIVKAWDLVEIDTLD